MPEPGDEGGDCVFCDSQTRLIGYEHRVVGVRCESCGLVNLMPDILVTGGKKYAPSVVFEDGFNVEDELTVRDILTGWLGWSAQEVADARDSRADSQEGARDEEGGER